VTLFDDPEPVGASGVGVDRVIVEADGGSRGNPGPAGYGAVVRAADTGAVLAERLEYLGVVTNNVAEYQGLIAGLAAAAELGARQVEVRMDSKLVVEQMSGRWQVKHPSMRPLFNRARELARSFGTISYQWIPRAQNAAADRLANQAMDAGTKKAPVAAAPVAAAPKAAAPKAAAPKAAAPTATGRPESSARTGRAESSARTGRAENNNAAVADGPGTRLVLLRHGVTEYSVVRRFAGRSDLDLTEEGVRQAARAADRVARLGEIAAVYSSPLLRCRHTASVAADRLGLPVELDDGLIETDFGDWDGYTQAEIGAKWPDELARWLADPQVAPPGGESFEATGRRARQARDRILRAQAGRTVLVVSHVSPIKALVRLALDAPPAAVHRMYLAPAALSVIDYFTDGTVSLRSFNETGHLD